MFQGDMERHRSGSCFCSSCAGFLHLMLYKSDEAKVYFKNLVKAIPVSDEPLDDNIISSNIVYKLEGQYDDYLMLKARVAQQGNEESFKKDLRLDCFMCSTVKIDVSLGFAALDCWPMVNHGLM